MRRVVLAAFLGLTLTSAAFGGGTITWPSTPLPPDANPAALIGTNNMYSSSVEQIAGGIKAGVDEYRKRLPDATVLVQGILPRGELPTDGMRAKIKAINKIVAGFADGKKVLFIDWGDKLLTPDGRYTKPMTGDFLHPMLPGYQIWADSIQPIIDQYFPPTGTPPANPPTP